MASIVAENQLAADALDQYIFDGAGDLNNVGFAREPSINVGEAVHFSCHGAGTIIDIYRIGYYGGGGWHKVTTITNAATTQPAAQTVANSNGSGTCTGWSTTASWTVPGNATSGLYIGVYRSSPGPNASWIPFCVRDDAATVDVIVQLSWFTWAGAYNHYGTPGSPLSGKNVYGSGTGVGNITERGHFMSLHRPVITRGTVPQTYWYACEYPLIRFLERNGYNIKYVTSMDVDQNPNLLNKGSIFLSMGHDEYWSKAQRNNVEAYRDRGGKLIFMSANEVFWKVRYDPAANGFWCIAAGQDVTTARGLVRIEDVLPSDRVLTRQGYRQVQHVTRMGDKDCLRLTLADGSTLECTADHRLALDSGWVEAGALKVGDRLLKCEPGEDSFSDGPALREQINVRASGQPQRGSCGSDSGLRFARRAAGALSTRADAVTSVRHDGRVGVVEKVPLRAADRPRQVLPLSPIVLRVPNEFEMGGVDAQLHAAQVINRHIALARQGANQQFVDDTMSLADRPMPAEVSVSSIGSSRPQPAPVGLEDDLALNTVGQRVHVHHNTVVDIEAVGVHTVYDIGVEDVHEFVVNGTVVHNCFKDTMPGPGSHAAGVALDPVEWTGTWKDTRWADRRPESWLTGTDFRMNGVTDLDGIIVKNPYAQLPVWGNSALNDGDVTLTRAIGFEADRMDPQQPTASTKVLAAYTRNINGLYADANGENYTGNGDLTWGIIAQRYNLTSVVVGFGTCQWSWTLDSTHDRTATAVQPAAQQFTINLLRDLGAAPGSLMPGMVLRAPVSLDNYGANPNPTTPTPGQAGLTAKRGSGATLKAIRGGGAELIARRGV